MKIPATKLQQFIGMDDYGKKLTIDRLSRELGLPISEIEKEIIDFEQGINTPSSKTDTNLPEKKSNFISSSESSEGTPNFITDAHRYRFTYDPSKDAKERQSNVNQAILCPHCNVGIAIPPIRPIKIMCPSCRMESVFEK
jgi:hypothetical protein